MANRMLVGLFGLRQLTLQREVSHFHTCRECSPRVATARDGRGDILWLAARVKEFLVPAVLLDPPRSAKFLASRNCASSYALVGENQEPDMKIRTVTGSTISLGKGGGLWLKYVIPCGDDWIAEIRIISGDHCQVPPRARVFVSQNPGVATLVSLAHERGKLEIKSDYCATWAT